MVISGEMETELEVMGESSQWHEQLIMFCAV